MYRNGFIIAVKNDRGQVLREAEGQHVYLPFNSEYKIFLKNDHPRRALVKIRIDGTDILGGQGLVLSPFSESEIERFVLDGNLSKGKKFKFVSLNDSKVQNPTSSKNGFIEVEFTLEAQPSVFYTTTVATWSPISNPLPTWWGSPTRITSEPDSCTSKGGGGSRSSSMSGNINCFSASMSTCDCNIVESFNADASQKGATVEGDSSSQTFGTTSIGELETSSTTLTLQILAPKDHFTPTTVEMTKVKYCTSCGMKLRYTDKYCSKCGERLE